MAPGFQIGYGWGAKNRETSYTVMCKTLIRQIILISFFLSQSSLLTYGQYTLSTGIRYDRFKDDTAAENIGSEITTLFSLSYRGEQLSSRVIGAYANSDFDSGNPAVSDASISSLTDTLVSVSYSVSDLPVTLIFGVDVNLPTGKEKLTTEQFNAELGDKNNLVEIDNFGDGFNLNLSFGLARQFSQVSLALGTSYIIRGEYDPTADISNDELNPADEFSLASIIRVEPSKTLSLTGFIGYVFFGTDQVNGQDSFREGDKLTLGTDIIFDLNPYRIAVSLQDSIQAKNKQINAATSVTAERETTNGDEFFASINFDYKVSKDFTLQAIADTRIFGENEDSSGNVSFDAGATRYAIGPGFSYQFIKNLYLNGLIKYFSFKEKQDAQLSEDITFKGINVDLGLTYLF